MTDKTSATAVWERKYGTLRLMVPHPYYVPKTGYLADFGVIRKHARKRHYYVHVHEGTVRTFVDLEEAKAWLLAMWRLST